MSDRYWPSIPAMFFERAGDFASRPLFWAKHAEGWKPVTWGQAETQITELARGLIGLGLEAGERVVILAESRPEWAVADLAVMAMGAISVPAYTTSTTEDYLHLLGNCGAAGLIVSTAALARKVLPAAAQVSSLKFIVAIDSLTQQSAVPIHLWDAVLAMGRTRDDDIAARVAALQPDDTACLIHTSGTGGLPKGAMLSHRGILANCRGAHEVLKGFGLGQEVFLSFLPLSHAYEHTAGFIFPLTIGAEIYFSTGAENLGTEMVEVHPTIMTAVPRLYEMLHRRITQGVERKGGLTAKLFHMTLALGLKRLDNGSLGPIEALKDMIGEAMVRKKMRQRFGGRLKAFVSGGGPLNVEIGRFFLALGVNVLQGYGQTETSPVVSVNPPGRIRIETVGPPVAEVEVKLAEDGEILVRGAAVMKGYWNDPEATARTIKDGWLHTGDVGVIDPDGYIRITDRKRDFIKTTGGEMIAPQRVEGFVTMQPGVAQAMVYGDRRNYVVALIVPDETLIRKDAAEQRKRIAEAVESANKLLAPLERVRRFAVIDEPFTIDNNRMTPTLKIRRAQITQDYAEVLEGLYKSAER